MPHPVLETQGDQETGEAGMRFRDMGHVPTSAISLCVLEQSRVWEVNGNSQAKPALRVLHPCNNGLLNDFQLGRAEPGRLM